MNILNMPFVGTYELRKKLPLLLAQLQKDKEGVVVNQKGKPKALLLPIKTYLQMEILIEELEDALRELADKNYLKALVLAKKEIVSGKGQKARKVFQGLGI